jgi:ubiquinone/menaquinone biosynthesis C-methylase UbiE
MMIRTGVWLAFLAVIFWMPTFAQEKSVRPGINAKYQNPDVDEAIKTFEGESREVFVKRHEIIAACHVKPGMVVADIGAGTGLHTRLFAKAVGDSGQVFAVDISTKFVEHIRKTSRAQGLRNITPVLCNEDSVDLPPHSVDLVFICDTYHHFEFPFRTLGSISRALKPGGKMVVVDFIRIPGVSREWVLNHVRAGQEQVENELKSSGLVKVNEVKKLLSENYIIVFEKPSQGDTKKSDR